jgi:hypothetical protein
MFDDVQDESDWIGHIVADANSLSRELRLSEPNEAFVDLLVIAIIKSATEIADLQRAKRDTARREKWEQGRK